MSAGDRSRRAGAGAALWSRAEKGAKCVTTKPCRHAEQSPRQQRAAEVRRSARGLPSPSAARANPKKLGLIACSATTTACASRRAPRSALAAGGDPKHVQSAPRAPVAQLDRVLGYEPRGRGFESCRARQSRQGSADEHLLTLFFQVTLGGRLVAVPSPFGGGFRGADRVRSRVAPAPRSNAAPHVDHGSRPPGHEPLRSHTHSRGRAFSSCPCPVSRA